MEQTGIQLQFPDSLFYAFPVVVILFILPIVLIYIVFVRTQYKFWIKVALIPVCLIAPLVASLFWPFLLKTSGLVSATGSDGTVPYTVVATELFGDYSEYVWGGITTIIVILLYKWSGGKKIDRQN